MTMNPKMKVLVLQGYFDLACPYRTVEYAIEHLDLAPALRSNVAIEHFDAGHMMYVEPASMQKFKRVLGAFVDANAG
jgi:carboxypeptidase C (cathepsin A)